MRTTLDLDDELIKAARLLAAERGTTLTAIIEEALALALHTPVSRSERFLLCWKTHPGRLHPGIDILDRDALIDAMERER